MFVFCICSCVIVFVSARLRRIRFFDVDAGVVFAPTETIAEFITTAKPCECANEKATSAPPWQSAPYAGPRGNRGLFLRADAPPGSWRT